MRLRRVQGRFTVMMYHSVGGARDPWTVSPRAFRHQMEVIRDRHSVVPLSDIETAARRGGISPGSVAVTFDDAFRDFLDHAFPLLDELGIPCALFVPTGCIGSENKWDSPYEGCSRKRILGMAELRELASSPLVEIGSHGVHHVRMTSLGDAQMRYEAEASKESLEQLLGEEVRMFAYPYGQLGDFSAATRRVLQTAGYRTAVTTHWGTCSTSSDPLRLTRVFLNDTDDDDTICRTIDGRRDWVGLRQRVGFAVRTARSMIRGSAMHAGGCDS